MESKSTSPILPSVAIIGAGVMGLGIGWKLARAGCQVTVFDRAEAGRGASWAAAGMLAAGIETEPSEDKLLGLTQFSQRLWPEFARSLEAETGLDLGYRDEGTLAVALTRDDVQRLRFSYEYQIGLGIELEWLSAAETRRREPYLKPGLAAAVFSPGDHQVDNRLVMTALKCAFSAAGGTLHEHTPVTAIDIHADRVGGVRTASGTHAADVVVLAAGAWSRHIEGLPADLSPPIRPLKGQMLAARMNPRTPLLSHVLWAPGVYLVPRRDGRLLIGATTEERGFDESMTVGGVYALLDAAWRVLPGVEELPIDEMWVGFRPGSRDDAPVLGDSRIAGLIFASGHHRNGILLLPATVDAVERLILRGEKIPEIQGFGIERFD